MKKLLKVTGVTLLAAGAVWTALTIWAESAGPKRSWKLGSQAAKRRALIVYDPDPFYNLDEQVSRSFGQSLADNGMRVTVATVKAVEESPEQSIDLYVFCTNTYNWAPDWSISSFIRQQAHLEGKPVVAITVGSSETESAQKALEKIILNKKANLLGSRSLWLMKPNDKSRAKESNITVAVSMAYSWGEEIAKQMTAH